MAKRLTEKQKSEIAENFKNGKTIEALSEEFNCTNSTITRNLKKNLGENIYKKLIEKNKNFDELHTPLESYKNDFEFSKNISKSQSIDDQTLDANQSRNNNFSSSEWSNFSLSRQIRWRFSSLTFRNGFVQRNGSRIRYWILG